MSIGVVAITKNKLITLKYITMTKVSKNTKGNNANTVLYSVACEYGNSHKQCKNKAKWHVTNGYGFDKRICTTHKNKMQRNGSIAFCNAI